MAFKRLKYVCFASTVAFFGSEIGVAFAQLDEIIVTARKREEQTQNVPIAVTAFDAKSIEGKFNSNLSDFARYAPNIALGDNQFTGGGLTATIRGIGFSDLEKTFESAVGVSVDGVFLGTNTLANVDVFDLESIEILRGPQGTLYGRNTIGGTINIRRSRPTGEWGFKGKYRIGNFNQHEWRAVVNAPIIDDMLAAKVSFLSKQDDSFQRNINRGGDRDPGQDLVSVSSKLLFTPNDNLDVLVSFDWFNDDSQFPLANNVTEANGGVFGAGGTTCDLTQGLAAGMLLPPFLANAGCRQGVYDVIAASGFKNSVGAVPFKNFIDGTSTTIEANWDIGNLTLTSITNFSESDEMLDEDNLGGPIEVFRAIRFQEYYQLSEEFRVTSNFDGPFNFVAGLYYLNTKYTIGSNEQPGQAFILGAPVQDFDAGQNLNAFAVFAEGSYDIWQDLTLSVGGRVTYEEKKFTSNTRLGGGGPFQAAAEEDWTAFTPRVILDYQYTDDILTYFSFSQGFRSGGFNGRAVNANTVGPYDPEKVTSFEVGVKSEWLDNRLRVNTALFRTKYDDKQEEVIRAAGSGTETLVENAATAVLQGMELEVLAVPVENFTFFGSLGYLDAYYDQFVDPLGFDRSTFDIRRSPRWTYSLGGDIFVPCHDGGFTFSGNHSWATKQLGTPTPGSEFAYSPAYGQTDFSLSYENGIWNLEDTNFKITGFVKDAFHKNGRLATAVDAGIFFFGINAPGRRWGAEVSVEF